MIQEFEENFDAKLRDFMRHLRDKSSSQYDHHLTNLFTRLDYNGFYSKLFEVELPGALSVGAPRPSDAHVLNALNNAPTRKSEY
jgi:hypothetical protein